MLQKMGNPGCSGGQCQLSRDTQVGVKSDGGSGEAGIGSRYLR